MNPIKSIQAIIDEAESIVIMQADNPDADSLGSALALEHIFGDMGKKPLLYCGVDIPGYLRYLDGWDRVSSELPPKFDASVIVDASTMTLLERAVEAGYQGWLAAKPCVVLDHHAVVENQIPFANVILNDADKSSACEVIYHLVKQLDWSISNEARRCLMAGILGDTQGLSNDLARPTTYRVLAEMLEAGVSRTELEEVRREYSKMPPEIFRYKASLIKRTELAADGKLAHVSIPQTEINQYSPLYNPAPLIQGDMLQTAGVQIAIVLKHYDDGRITGAIRCNSGTPIAAELAKRLGGGGHSFASGFKITDGRNINDVRAEILKHVSELIDH